MREVPRNAMSGAERREEEMPRGESETRGAERREWCEELPEGAREQKNDCSAKAEEVRDSPRRAAEQIG